MLEYSARIEAVAPEADPASDFVDAMSCLAGGVSILTCRLEGRPWGMTVTAVASVSTAPPILLVSIASAARSRRAIAATGTFGVSILDDQRVLAARYAALDSAPKYLERFTDPGPSPSMSPVVAGCLAHLDCEVVRELEVADHTIFFGRARYAQSVQEGDPLLYFRRRYTTTRKPA